MSGRETMLKGLRGVSDQHLAGAFDFEGGVELLATLRADLQAAYATEKALDVFEVRTHPFFLMSQVPL